MIALIVTAAVVATGYPAQRLDLGDGAVWVANGQQQAIGRANTEILELNSVVSTAGTDLKVLQGGARVLLLDRTESAVDIIDPATSDIEDTVPMPPNQTQVFLAAERVVIFEVGTGELWIVAASDFADFDSQSPATLSLGTDAVVAVDPAGRLFAYSPAVSQVYGLDLARSSTVESTFPLTVPTAALPRLSISSVNGEWVVLDSLDSRLYFESRSVDLADVVGVTAGSILQTASADGDRVLVSHNGGLVAVPLSGTEPVVVLGEAGSTPAAPFRLGNCEFAAWASAIAWRGCPEDGVAGAQFLLAGISASAQLEYLANGNQIVLNDRRSGQSWAVQRSGELIDNWDELIVTDDEQPEEQQNNTENPPEIENLQVPPVAVSDTFGARPGRSTVVPVLLNDYDANGDVLVVGDLVPIDESVGRIELINERQQIQLTLNPGATGQVRFPYSISDGRGGLASSEVVISIRADLENSPPQQVRATQLEAESGARVSSNVLSDWVDPDGDPFYL
ncbi:MAG: Ig-like domain-containing protein, partial [Salinibacterium sp.]|nr:Ig-like domain-containing protein [Salinibacterium sp.]